MLYIGPEQNEAKIALMLQNKSLNLKSVEHYIQKSLHRDQEEFELLKPLMNVDEVIEQRIVLCQMEILLSTIRRNNMQP
jgi:hypothetical protein